MTSGRLPILVAGAGAMGGALISGWRRADALTGRDLILRDPRPGPEALAAVAAGAILNPNDGVLIGARTVIFAVKPQIWRAAASELAPHLAPDAAIISVVAGVTAGDLAEAFDGRSVARVMPTLGAAIGQGSIALWSADSVLTEEAAALFEPLGAVTRLADEGLMHVATAASGSAPAYLYAFIEALEAGAVEAGLSTEDAARMVRTTICGAAALLATSGEDPAGLRHKVTSPGGTTEAALEVLLSEQGLKPLLSRAVRAAVGKSRELGS